MTTQADWPRRRAAAVLLVGLGFTPLACGGDEDLHGKCPEVKNEVADLKLPTYDPVPAGKANLGLSITSVNTRETPVTLWLDDDVLFIGTLPKIPDSTSCGGDGPVFRYDFAVNRGKHTFRAVDGEHDKTVDFTLGANTRWISVGSQDPFDLSLKVWKTRPEYG